MSGELHRDDSGFSLVEILVALFIMALASAMIVMAVPARPDPLEAETGRFESVLARTVDRSISSGLAHGIRLGETSYRVYVRINGRWVPARGGALKLPHGMTVTIPDRREEAGTPLPQIVADASGIVSGPSVRFSLRGRFRDVVPVEVVAADD